MVRSDTRPVVRLAAHLVERARETCPTFAGDTAPLHEGQLSDLFAHLGCTVAVFPFRSSSGALAIGLGGRPLIGIDANASRPQRAFGARHELAHVLMGEVEEPTFFSDSGYMVGSERIADLFALADLVPGWTLERARSGAELLREVVQGVGEYAEGWPEDRLADRVELRLRLFQEHGI